MNAVKGIHTGQFCSEIWKFCSDKEAVLSRMPFPRMPADFVSDNQGKRLNTSSFFPADFVSDNQGKRLNTSSFFLFPACWVPAEESLCGLAEEAEEEEEKEVRRRPWGGLAGEGGGLCGRRRELRWGARCITRRQERPTQLRVHLHWGAAEWRNCQAPPEIHCRGRSLTCGSDYFCGFHTHNRQISQTRSSEEL